MNKKELRSVYLEKRITLTDAEYALRNQKIEANFFSGIKLGGVRVIHVFLPMKKYKEPDTWPIIERIRSEYPAIRFSIPRVDYKSQELENFYFDSADQLRENKWGIQEPQFGERTPVQDIDLVIVPLLVVDKHGHRVGYGKGFYDKLLSLCKPECQKVGISIFEEIDQITDVSDFDIPLDYCITPFTVQHHERLQP